MAHRLGGAPYGDDVSSRKKLGLDYTDDSTHSLFARSASEVGQILSRDLGTFDDSTVMTHIHRRGGNHFLSIESAKRKIDPLAAGLT
jgi:hypothetical protein